MITLCIVEDEAKTRALLRSMVSDLLPWISIVGEAENLRTGVQLLATEAPDIVLLDVEMPDGTGFQLLERLPQLRAQVIFVTAYDHYVVQALRSGALDYVEKPVNPDELIAALLRARQKVEASASTATTRVPTPQKIAIPTRTGVHYLAAEEIEYVKADNVYSELHTINANRPMIVSRTLKDVAQTLEPLGFVRVHRSYLVNKLAIVELGKTDGGFVVLKSGKEIQLGPQYRDAAMRIIQALGHLL